METLLGTLLAILLVALTLKLLSTISKYAILIGVLGVLVAAWLHPGVAWSYAHVLGQEAVRLIERVIA